MAPAITSIQVGRVVALGKPEAPEPMDRPWTTGFFKAPVEGVLWLGEAGLSGDEQADRRRHGGPEKAVLVYAEQHYLVWRSRPELAEIPYGAFGENFTVSGQTEASVCIGDIYAIGDARVQVSQPRQPCWKLSRRWRIRDLSLQVQRSGRTGWYFRVLKCGEVEPGLPLVLEERPYSEWTVQRANDIAHRDRSDREAAGRLAVCPALAGNWRKTLSKRARSGENPDAAPCLWGEN